MKNLKELMKNVGMFVHELRDADAIDNKEEKQYVRMIELARKELDECLYELERAERFYDLLKQDGVRVSFGNSRWMVRDGVEFVVYEHLPYKRTQELYRGSVESVAFLFLLKGLE